MKKVIILGGGVTGCTAARELVKRDYEVTLIERNPYLGGGCHTFFKGGHPYTEGPRMLTVINDRIFEYINSVVPLRKFKFFADTYIEQDREFYSFPIYWDDVLKMPDKDKIEQELKNLPKESTATNFEDIWLSKVGPTLYGKYIKTYTEKMWQVKSNKIFEGYTWSLKGTPIQYEDRSASDRGIKEYAYPYDENGFNPFFENCVEGAKVRLNTEVRHVDLEKKQVYLEQEVLSADVIISTLPLEELMENAYGSLQYVGREFYPIVFPTEHIFKDGHQFIYYPNDEKYTRIVEYKTLTMHKSPDTLIVVEVPSNVNKLYPYDNIPEAVERANLYKNALPQDVYSIGRLGSYQYLGIDHCIEQVWELMKEF